MTEASETSQKPHIGREEVESAFRPFLESGITNPDVVGTLPNGDKVNQMHTEWVSQEMDGLVEGSPERLLKDLEVSTLFTDMGFNDTEYVDEVANDWLLNTLDEAEAKGYSAVAEKIRAKIDELHLAPDNSSQN